MNTGDLASRLIDAPDDGVDETRWQPFPTHVFPPAIGGFVNVGASTLGCDESYIALPLLAALASLIGNTRRIQLKRGWAEPAVVWTGIVGESGTLKSPAMELALRSIERRQAEEFRRHAEDVAAYELELARWEAAKADWKRKRKDRGDPPPKPDAPVAVRHICGDTTIEALALLLQHAPRGLLLARDELSGWLRSFDQYKAKGKGGDTAHWLALHGARSLLVDRKTGIPVIYVPRAAVSITGGIQPDALRRALSREYFENGLTARLLFAAPPRRVKRWSDAEIPQRVEDSLERIVGRLLELRPNAGDDGQPYPVDVPLSDDGRAEWVEFYSGYAKEQAQLSGDVAAAASKLEGYAARLALVIHFARWAEDVSDLRDPDAIDADSVRAGVELSRWFYDEAKRVYSLLGESDEDREQRRLVEWLHARGGSGGVRELLRSSRMFASSADAQAAFDTLAASGRGFWEQPAPGATGGHPSARFRLVDTVDVDTTPVFDSASGGFVNVNSVNGRNGAARKRVPA